MRAHHRPSRSADPHRTPGASHPVAPPHTEADRRRRAVIAGSVISSLRVGSAALTPWPALTMLGAAAWPGRADAVTLDEPAPGFRLPGTTGEADLSVLRGRWVYVDFWASWCAPCRLSFPWMAALHQRHHAAGLEIVAINVDAQRRDAERFLAEMSAPFTVAFDPQGATPRAWSVRAMPTSVLVDRDGRVRWEHRGFRREDAQLLEPRIAAALAAG